MAGHPASKRASLRIQDELALWRRHTAIKQVCPGTCGSSLGPGGWGLYGFGFVGPYGFAVGLCGFVFVGSPLSRLKLLLSHCIAYTYVSSHIITYVCIHDYLFRITVVHIVTRPCHVLSV